MVDTRLTPFPRPLLIKQFARRFRDAARQFRDGPDRSHTSDCLRRSIGHIPAAPPPNYLDAIHSRHEDRLMESCGVWLIEADKAGLIPAAYPELRALIDFHRQEHMNHEPLPPGTRARQYRCPSNLFQDIVGGHGVAARFLGRGADGRPQVELVRERGRVKETGGLMPQLVPGHLHQTRVARLSSTCEALADIIESATEGPVVEPPKHDGSRPKRSTTRGEARAKLIAALTLHHKYADGSCLNLAPVGNNRLAKAAQVSVSSASAFFEKEFQGYEKYRAVCRDTGRLVAALKLLNSEFAPHNLYGRCPADEDDRVAE